MQDDRQSNIESAKDIVAIKVQQENSLEHLRKHDGMLEKLTDVSANITKMLAVHEQNIISNSRDIKTLEKTLEKESDLMSRERIQLERKMELIETQLYNNMESTKNEILGEISKNRDLNIKQAKESNTRFNKIEKITYTIAGGIALGAFILTVWGPQIFLAVAGLHVGG